MRECLVHFSNFLLVDNQFAAIPLQICVGLQNLALYVGDF